MAKTIVKDYETIEIDREVYVCDSCGHEGEEDEFDAIAVVDEPDRDSFRYESDKFHACHGCTGKREVSLRLEELKEIEEEHDEKMNDYSKIVDWSLVPFAMIGGYIASPLALLFTWMFWFSDPLNTTEMFMLLIAAVVVGGVALVAQLFITVILIDIVQWATGIDLDGE